MPRVQLHGYWPRETSESPANAWLLSELRALFSEP
jgi:hypothetical protein